MKKSVKFFAGMLLCAAFAAATGCTSPSDSSPGMGTGKNDPPVFTPHESVNGVADRLTLDSEKLVVFSRGGSSDFYHADGYSNGGMFNCTWRKNNAEIKNGVMSMSVVRYGGGFSGAEYRSKKVFSYGFYSVCMKAADCSGVISSFFTYTNDPVWDEIDIEFLGKDMTKVQFNYYTTGEGEHEYLFELGFDASKAFHEYAFDWQRDSITWYIDGKAVYRATENLPSHPMQIMMNVWNGKGVDEWSGALNQSKLPANAQYAWFGYAPHDE